MSTLVAGYFAVQLSRPPDGWAELPALTASARAASERLRRAGVPVRFLRSVFVPEDDACFYLYEAGSVDAVRRAAEDARIPFQAVVEPVGLKGAE